MSYFDDHPDQALRTPDQVSVYLKQQLDKLRATRAACDVLTFSPLAETPARAQRKAYNTFLMELGNFYGLTRMAHACERLSDEAYNHFIGEAKATVLPTVFEASHG